MLFGILFFTIGCAMLILSIWSAVIAAIIIRKRNFSKTAGFITKRSHKRNATVIKTTYRGHLYLDTIKNLTRAKYLFNVGNKSYFIRKKFQLSKKETPTVVSVEYHKKFPMIAYIENDEPFVFLYTIFFLSISAACFIIGAALLQA